MPRSASGRLSACALVVVGLAIASVGQAQPQDVLGIWFDQAAGADTLVTSLSPEIVTAYLLLENASAVTGVSGWECGVEIAGEGVQAVSWELSAGLNVATAPEFQVGIGVDNRLFWGPAVVLATVRLVVTNPGAAGRLYIHPYANPSLQDPPGSGHPLRAPLYAAGHDPGDLRPLRPASGDEALPVAVINPATAPLCHPSTGRLDFGTVVLGNAREAVLSLANVGGGVLAGAVGTPDDPAFAVIEGDGAYALGPGEVRTIRLRCAPLASGPLAGTLAACGAVALVGVGAETGYCSVEPSALDFGEVGVGRPRCLDVTIANPSAAPVAGEVLISGSGFTVTAGGGAFQLDPEQTHAVTVCFTPPDMGATAGELDLGSACGRLPLAGSGVILPPRCALAGAPLDFRTVHVGDASDLTFTLRNAGAGLLTGAVSIAGDHYALTAGSGPFALAELESLAVTVRYSPSAPGTHEAQVDLGTGLCGPVTCLGGAPLCTLSADTLHFGEVTVGSSAERALLIGNAGGGVLSGHLPRWFCASYWLPGAQSDIGFDFAVAAGSAPISLMFAFAPDTAGRLICQLPPIDLCGPVVLDGTGVWPPPRCSLSTSRLDIGAVPVGSAGAGTFLVRNPGPAPLSGEISLDDPVFTIIEGGGPFTLSQDQYRRVTVQARPPAPGAYSCAVQTGAPGCGDITCVATCPVPHCRVLPVALDFGEVPLGGSSSRSVTIRNDGPGRLDGVLASGCEAFRIEGDGRYSLPQFRQVAFTVRYIPEFAGSAVCSLTTGSSCDAVPCSGVGVALPAIAVVTPPDPLRFGTVPVGGRRDLSFVLSNAGGDTLRGTVTVAGAGFSLVGGSAYRLAWGQTQTFVVRFAPVAALSCTGSVIIGGDGPTLACTGSGSAPASDLLGIWFDAQGLSSTRRTTSSNEQVTAWLLIKSPVQRADLASWECCVSLAGDGVRFAQWTWYGGAIAVGPPCSRVLPITPLAAVGGVTQLARVDFLQSSPALTTLFFIQAAPSPALPGVPAFATVADPTVFLPLRLPVSYPGDPVAVVNGGTDPPVPVLAPAPAVTCSDGEVQMTLGFDATGGDACLVYRRIGDGPARPLPGAPAPDGRGGALYTDPTAPSNTALHYSYALLRDGAEIARSAESAVTCAAEPPSATTLHPVFPNPFNPVATVRFDLARPGRARLTVYDLAGRRVRTLCDDGLPAGAYTRVWDGRDDRGQPSPSGTYYARLAVDGVGVMQKMALIR